MTERDREAAPDAARTAYTEVVPQTKREDGCPAPFSFPKHVIPTIGTLSDVT